MVCECSTINLCIDPADLSAALEGLVGPGGPGGGGSGFIPDLRLDQEVLWPARRGGKQVYAKLINFGGFAAPYGLRMVTHNIADLEWKQISWDHSSIASSTDARERTLALVSTPENTGQPGHWRFVIDNNSVQVNMLSATDYRVWDKIELCILYTKSTDEALP